MHVVRPVSLRSRWYFLAMSIAVSSPCSNSSDGTFQDFRQLGGEAIDVGAGRQLRGADEHVAIPPFDVAAERQAGQYTVVAERTQRVLRVQGQAHDELVEERRRV